MAEFDWPVSIEEGGRFVRGVAVPYGETAFVRFRDEIVAETFDELSVPELPAGQLPLRVSHDRNVPPAGRVLGMWKLRDGIVAEAELIGSASAVEDWRARFAAGLHYKLSIGFSHNPKEGIWSRPPAGSRLPRSYTPRGVEIVELSLVQEPSYNLAGIHGVYARRLADQMAHEASTEAIEWVKSRKARAKT